MCFDCKRKTFFFSLLAKLWLFNIILQLLFMFNDDFIQFNSVYVYSTYLWEVISRCFANFNVCYKAAGLEFDICGIENGRFYNMQVWKKGPYIHDTENVIFFSIDLELKINSSISLQHIPSILAELCANIHWASYPAVYLHTGLPGPPGATVRCIENHMKRKGIGRHEIIANSYH